MVAKHLLLISIVFAVNYHLIDGLKILGIFTVPGRSHFVSPAKLLQELARRGHDVDVVSHFPQKKTIPNYRDLSLEGSTRIATNNMTFEETRRFSSFSMRHFMSMIGTNICDLLSHSVFEQLLKKPKKSYDVVMVELFGAHCYLGFGKHFDAPIVAMVVSKMPDWLYGPFGIPFNTGYISSLFSNFDQEMSFYEKLQNTLMSSIIIPQINYYMEEQLHHVEKYFGRKLSTMAELYNDVGILLVNSHYSLNGILPLPKGVVEIGGLHVDDTDPKISLEIKKWLDESKDGCVYFSFGSMLRIETFPEKTLKIFYETFERISPIRVLMKIFNTTLLPPGLPKNVLTAKWLPQIAVLKHENVKAFITHGGLMGTQESVAHGVPMIGMPFFGDQHTNINVYVRRKIAIKLDHNTVDTESLTQAIKTILFDPEYKKNILVAQGLFMDRPIKPMDAAVYWIEFAAKRGNILRSPATKLSWWQYYLIDVYGFITICVITVIYVTKLFISYAWMTILKIKSVANLKTVIATKKNK